MDCGRLDLYNVSLIREAVVRVCAPLGPVTSVRLTPDRRRQRLVCRLHLARGADRPTFARRFRGRFLGDRMYFLIDPRRP